MNALVGFIRVVALLGLLQIGATASEMREWKSASGKSITARLADWNTLIDKVKLRRADGSIIEAPIVALSVDDQHYLSQNRDRLIWTEINGLVQEHSDFRRIRTELFTDYKLETTDSTSPNGKSKLRVTNSIKYRERLHSKSTTPVSYAVSNNGTVVFIDFESSYQIGELKTVAPNGEVRTVLEVEGALNFETPEPKGENGITALPGTADVYAFVGKNLETLELALYKIRIGDGDKLEMWQDDLEFEPFGLQVLESVGKDQLISHSSNVVLRAFHSAGVANGDGELLYDFVFPLHQTVAAGVMVAGYSTDTYLGPYLIDMKRKTIAPIGESKQDTVNGKKGIWDLSISPDGASAVHYNYEKEAFMWLELQTIHYN